jgi:hypothetical protein
VARKGAMPKSGKTDVSKASQERLAHALLESAPDANGLADFGVSVEPIRKGGQERGLVTGFKISWWRKDTPELQAVDQELRQPRVGRMARLKQKAMGEAIPRPLAAEIQREMC